MPTSSNDPTTSLSFKTSRGHLITRRRHHVVTSDCQCAMALLRSASASSLAHVPTSAFPLLKLDDLLMCFTLFSYSSLILLTGCSLRFFLCFSYGCSGQSTKSGLIYIRECDDDSSLQVSKAPCLPCRKLAVVLPYLTVRYPIWQCKPDCWWSCAWRVIYAPVSWPTPSLWTNSQQLIVQYTIRWQYSIFHLQDTHCEIMERKLLN